MADAKVLGVPRKFAIPAIVVGAGVAGYMIYSYEKKKSAAAQAAASTAQAQASTAYGYGATTQPYGYGTNNGYYGYGQGQAYFGYGTPYPPTQTTPPAANTTNAEWAQAAIAQLEGDGYNPMSLTSALGAYELGQPVTANQEGMIDAAIGVEGYPPVEGPNGYPPKIHVQGTPGGGGGGGQGGNVSVPSVTGDRASVARQKIRAAGLKAVTSGGTTGVVKSQEPRAGTRLDKGDPVNLTLGK